MGWSPGLPAELIPAHSITPAGVCMTWAYLQGLALSIDHPNQKHTVNICPGTWLGSLPGREGVGSVVGGADDRNRTALSQTSVLSKVQALSPQVTVTSSRCQARLLPGPCSSHQV